MKAAALRELTRDELNQKRQDLVEERFNLAMRRSLKPLDNPLRLRMIDREIARIKTILHEDALDLRALAREKTAILDKSKGKGE